MAPLLIENFVHFAALVGFVELVGLAELAELVETFVEDNWLYLIKSVVPTMRQLTDGFAVVAAAVTVATIRDCRFDVFVCRPVVKM